MRNLTSTSAALQWVYLMPKVYQQYSLQLIYTTIFSDGNLTIQLRCLILIEFLVT